MNPKPSSPFVASYRLAIALAITTPLAALVLFQGMITAGLVPLAVFGPVYAISRSGGAHGERARRQAARVTVAASAGVGMAFLPAALGTPVAQPAAWASLGVALVAAGAGALAAQAGAPAGRGMGRRDRKRWAFVDAMRDRHALGLALLGLVALPSATLVGILREAEIARLDGVGATLPDAVFGAHAVEGTLVLPDPTSTIVLAIPLSLAPLALGFLTSPKRAAPFAAGGLAVLLLAPLVVAFDVPLRADTGAWVPISILDRPGLAVVEALAPGSAGLLAGAALTYALKRHRLDPRAVRAFWAIGAALVTIPLWGLLGATIVAGGVLASALTLVLAGERAPFGFAVVLGAGAGGLLSMVLSIPDGWATGALVGAAVGSAAATYAAADSLASEGDSLRSPWTLAYVLAALLAVGLVYALVGGSLVDGSLPFPTPHARALGAGLAAIIEGQGVLLVLWGLLAGALIEAVLGVGAWIAVGALAGPGIALLVLAGSLLRALWEKGLLARAREGYVMKGQMGYELLRTHVLVASVLAGEALAIVIAAAVG